MAVEAPGEAKMLLTARSRRTSSPGSRTFSSSQPSGLHRVLPLGKYMDLLHALLREAVPHPRFLDLFATLWRRLALPPHALYLSLLYTHRLVRTTTADGSNSARSAHPMNPIKLGLASLILAAKYLLDHGYRNITWASLSGIDLGVIESMERAFLKRIGWRLHVTTHEWASWVDTVDARGLPPPRQPIIIPPRPIQKQSLPPPSTSPKPAVAPTKTPTSRIHSYVAALSSTTAARFTLGISRTAQTLVPHSTPGY